MKGAVFMWMLLFCGAASLQFVFSMEDEDESIQDLHEVGSETDLQEDEQSPVQKRNLVQFASMIRCATRRNPFDYNDYGNWCGVGGGGRPVDGVDRCCRAHDMCYRRSRRYHRRCYPKWRSYRYRARRRRRRRRCRITCKNRWGSCEKAVCECDRVAALCFARNRYHRRYKKKKSWWGR